MDRKNTIKVYTTSNGAELNISAPSTKQVISATNNRAQYFAEQAKKYRDEAKQHRDNAKYYSEQNSDVTFEYINNVRAALEDKISAKQDCGDYALREEIPDKVSELDNDQQFINKGEFEMNINKLKLPSQEGNTGKFLTTDGENPSWVGLNSFELFDTKISDRVLSYEELKGWALQGTYVYKEAIVGSIYGYPDFYARCLKEYNQATSSETVNGVIVKVHSNGHKFYDIADKAAIDDFFDSTGSAWFYGVDTVNERIFLPRNNFFDQLTGNASEAGVSVQAGLPNITGGFQTRTFDGSNTGAFTNGSETTGGYTGTQTAYWVSFDASLSNPIYGNSSTVQPNAVKKLLYICVGNTVSDTSWVDVVTQVEDGVKDLEDKTLEGIERLKQASTALTQTQITNCLLEVPQNIKLELNNGTLTLKAGSVVTVPNGFEADGTTPKFDYVLIESDKRLGISDSSSTSTQSDWFVFYNTDSTAWVRNSHTANIFSGATAPTVSGNYAVWYDTANNVIKLTSNKGSTWTTQGTALPLCSATRTSGIATSIDQVFNGMGYIGSAVWIDKGVKGLIPNGRNEDGTLKNIEVVTSKLTTDSYTNNSHIFFGFTENGDANLNGQYSYDEINNYAYNGDAIWSVAICGTYDIVDGKITNFQPQKPFRAVDYNDFEKTPHIIETYKNGTSWYRLWSDGWCEQGGRVSVSKDSNVTVTFLKSFANTDYYANWISCSGAVNTGSGTRGADALTTTSMRIYNGQDVAMTANWQACGYMN